MQVVGSNPGEVLPKLCTQMESIALRISAGRKDRTPRNVGSEALQCRAAACDTPHCGPEECKEQQTGDEDQNG
jgi:hypothetical protein